MSDLPETSAPEGANWPGPFASTMSQPYQDLQHDYFTMKQQAQAAEARAAQLQRELAEALDALADMYSQYCAPPYGHEFMSAGEGAADVLGRHGFLPNGEFGAVVWPEAPAPPAPAAAPVAPEAGAGGEEGGCPA